MFLEYTARKMKLPLNKANFKGLRRMLVSTRYNIIHLVLNQESRCQAETVIRRTRKYEFGSATGAQSYPRIFISDLGEITRLSGSSKGLLERSGNSSRSLKQPVSHVTVNRKVFNFRLIVLKLC